jgi:hypothetical protein
MSALFDGEKYLIENYNDYRCGQTSSVLPTLPLKTDVQLHVVNNERRELYYSILVIDLRELTNAIIEFSGRTES